MAVLICGGIAGRPLTVSSASPDEHLVLHYDFQGETDEERLANKVGGSDSGSLTVTSPGALSYVREGYAFVHSAKGEYISAELGEDVRSIQRNATMFVAFRAEGNSPSSVGDIAQIGGTVRLAIDTNNKLFTRMGSKFASDAATQKVVQSPVSRDAWVWVAVTIQYDEAGNVTEQFFLSTDEGATWSVSEFTMSGVEGMLASAQELLLGKVSRGIDDRGTSFYYRDFRLYDRVLTQEELTEIEVPAVEIEAPVTPPTEDPTEEPDPDRILSEHLVVHYDFLGNTTEEMLRDKATAGVSREDLMMYSSVTDGEKDSWLRDGTAYISSKQSNFLFAMPGEDIKGLTRSMTAFVVFQPTGDNPTNPGDFFTIDNNVRFGFHNANDALFSGVGPSFGLGGVTSAPLERGEWIYAAISLIWDAETGKVAQTIYWSTDEGETYASVSRVVSGVTEMYSNATYLIFGKIAPGMEDRGTNFCFKDIRVYDCALTQEELASIEVAEYVPGAPDDPDNPGDSDNPSETDPPAASDASDEPSATAQPGSEEQPGDGTSPAPSEQNGGCASSVAPSAMLLPAMGVIALSAAVWNRRRHSGGKGRETALPGKP